MNKRKQSLKDRIIKKLGGYTESEYQMLNMPLPIYRSDKLDTDRIRAKVRIPDERMITDIEGARSIVRDNLIWEIGKRAYEYAVIDHTFDVEHLEEVYCAEVIVVNRRVIDEK